MLAPMSAEEEENQMVSLAKVKMDDDGNILEDRIQCRLGADFPVVTKEEVNFMDVAPNQIASVAASLIPFLEHDDAPGAHPVLGKPGLRGSRFRWLWVGVGPSCAPGGRHCGWEQRRERGRGGANPGG